VDSRISKVLGRMLAALGALAIVMAMVSPAGASPDGHTPNGKATGYGHNHDVVDNSGSMDQLAADVDRCWAWIQGLAAAAPAVPQNRD